MSKSIKSNEKSTTIAATKSIFIKYMKAGQAKNNRIAAWERYNSGKLLCKLNIDTIGKMKMTTVY